MSQSPQNLRMKIGDRYWLLTIMYSLAPPENLRSMLIDDPHKPDILLIFGLNESLRKQWIEAVAVQCGTGWGTGFIESGLSTIEQSLTGPCLVAGKQRLLRRFYELFAPDQEEQSEDNPVRRETVVDYPDLPDPAEVPRFRQEAYLDPFGQNPQFLDAAWSRIAEFVGSFAKQAHAHGVAVTLPLSSEGVLAHAWPWRAVGALAPSSNAENVAESALQMAAPADVDETICGLDLVQRCLLTLAAHPETLNVDEWQHLAETIEDLGFILVSHNIHAEGHSNQLVDAGFLIGRRFAQVHSKGVIHGDLNPHNVYIDQPNRTVTLIDFANSRGFDRPLTAQERAMDLAIFKLHCEFLQWEAVKLGYRSVAPKEAEEVFQLI